MITTKHIATAQHVIVDSGAAEQFRQLLTPKGPGRRFAFHPGVFLIGMFLSAHIHAQTHIRLIHKVLTEDLNLDQQYIWGVRKAAVDGKPGWVLSEANLQNVSRAIKRVLSYGEFMPEDMQDDEDEKARRKANLEQLIDTIITATLIPRPAGAANYAIDDSGIWASERARKKIESAPVTEGDEETIIETTGADLETADPISGTTNPLARKRRKRDKSDAGYGVKTAKDGTRNWYYGYALHALVRVPENLGDDTCTEPALVERVRLTPAGQDIVDVSLELIDSVRASGQPIKHLMADRHYSYKKIQRWLFNLLKRNISQVVHLRADDQGFREWDGMLFAAGHAHCPATPQHLGDIRQPALEATDQDWEDFYTRIEERQAYAAQRTRPLTVEGETRWGCPALNGTVGCPLREGTLQAARQLNLPIVHNPPAHPPQICKQKTVGLTISTPEQATILKTHQKYYGGSRKHVALAGRRTYVEGFFGVLKGDTAANKNRGSSLYTGIAHASIETAIFSAVANIISLRAWHKKTELGDPTHPLLAPSARAYGYRYITEEEAHEYSPPPPEPLGQPSEPEESKTKEHSR